MRHSPIFLRTLVLVSSACCLRARCLGSGRRAQQSDLILPSSARTGAKQNCNLRPRGLLQDDGSLVDRGRPDERPTTSPTATISPAITAQAGARYPPGSTVTAAADPSSSAASSPVRGTGRAALRRADSRSPRRPVACRSRHRRASTAPERRASSRARSDAAGKGPLRRRDGSGPVCGRRGRLRGRRRGGGSRGRQAARRRLAAMAAGTRDRACRVRPQGRRPPADRPTASTAGSPRLPRRENRRTASTALARARAHGAAADASRIADATSASGSSAASGSTHAARRANRASRPPVELLDQAAWSATADPGRLPHVTTVSTGVPVVGGDVGNAVLHSGREMCEHAK